MGGKVSHLNIAPTFTPPVYKDLVTFALDDRPVAYDNQRPLYVDAENPAWALNGRQVRLLVRSLIAGLRHAGNVESGDCVLVNLPNNVLYSAIFYSIIGAGGVYMGINPSSQRAELDHFLGLANPKLIITTQKGLALLTETARAKGIPESRICVLDDFAISRISSFMSSRPSTPINKPDNEERLFIQRPSHMNFSSLLDYGEEDWVRFDDKERSVNTAAAMFTTSGTGGLPKGAILSHHSIIMHHLSLHYETPYETSRLLSIPMFHLFGALFTHLFPTRYGETCYILPRFDVAQFLHTVYFYKITETFMVPAMVQALNKFQDLELSEFLRSLRYVGTAGAALDAHSATHFQAKLHRDAQVSQLWGMTETGVAFQMRYGERDNTGSIGRLLSNYEVKLIDTNGNRITTDDLPGEMYIRGPGLLTSYKGIPMAKEEDGWFRTGDIVSVNEGKYYILGRSKELIKVRGWQVSPAEIEGVLLKHPFVDDAAVIGIQRRNSQGHLEDELVRAFVVRRTVNGATSAENISADSIYQFARSQLVSYKSITGGIVFVQEIPRTPSGKIQRYKLAEMNAYRELMSGLLSQQSDRALKSTVRNLGLMCTPSELMS
ncbi:adenylate-forming enzyme AfeA [Talaromyces proteolyticus]|uniref:Adenylate-forming enzyme AfeA n=1 Tax=Talaromyces proteolyticus TaxID=1131652 RepID=A0AAD4KMZ2_9EURO|nr:adenylate-forming enzyme AfeA [Talaromyces proteolyticus]KAH8695266.1 adenylate-forming enzyme AfeA [Talaromyces proteolyticus]